MINMFYNIKSLKEKILEYNKKRLINGSSIELVFMYENILEELRKLVYYMPYKYKLLKEDECSEFLLFMESYLKNIIFNYNKSQYDFGAFIYSVLNKKLKTFKKRQLIKSQNEAVFEFSNMLYDTAIAEIERFEDFLDNPLKNPVYFDEAKHMENIEKDLERSIKRLSDDRDNDIQNILDIDVESVSLRMFLYICKNHKTTRKRFFIYLMSFAISFTEENIIRICKIMGFDIPETLFYMDEMRNKGDILLDKINTEIENRNFCFLRNLFLENRLQSYEYRDDDSNILVVRDRLLRFKKSLETKNKTIRTHSLHTPRGVVAEVLGVSVGTVQLSCFFIRNILAYCVEKEEYLALPENKGWNYGYFGENSVLCNGVNSLEAEDCSARYDFYEKIKEKTEINEKYRNSISHKKKKSKKDACYSRFGVSFKLYDDVEKGFWKREKKAYNEIFYPDSVFGRKKTAEEVE